MKYTVVLMDEELADHVSMTFHVTADNPTDAVRQAYLDYASDRGPESEEDRLWALEFALDLLKPILLLTGHVTPLRIGKPVDNMRDRLLADTQAKSDRLARRAIADKAVAEARR